MSLPAIDSLELENFTAFKSIKFTFSPGINILIGRNGTGKTHVLKVLHAATAIARTQDNLAAKLVRVFLPHEGRIGRLAHRQPGSVNARIALVGGMHRLLCRFSNHTVSFEKARVFGAPAWVARHIDGAYIPVKEMLANAPGFRSLYASREIHFEEVYADIIDRAYRPPLKGPIDSTRKRLLTIIQRAIDGKVEQRGEEFFLRNRQGQLEFTLLAEGMRKLALLWLLIQNGTFRDGSVLYWDEPETNLNPSVHGEVVEIMLALQRIGVQVFLATHDYTLLKEFDLRLQKGDSILYHSLFRDGSTKELAVRESPELKGLHPNTIMETFESLYDRHVTKALGKVEGR